MTSSLRGTPALQFGVFCFSLWLIAGCARSGIGGAGDIMADQEAQRLDELSPFYYVRSDRVSGFGNLESFSILPEAFAKQKAELSGRRLRRLGYGGDIGRVYAVEDPSGGSTRSRIAVLEPKVFLRTLAESESGEVQPGLDDQVVIHTSIALVTGLSDTVASGYGSLPLPVGFQLKDRKLLLSEISGALNAEPEFLGHVECPEKFTLMTSSGMEFRGSVMTPLKNCPLDTLIPAALSFRREDWEAIGNALTTSGALDLTASINLSVPITVEYARFHLGRDRILRTIEDSIGNSKEVFSSDELSKVLASLVDDIEQSFHFNGSQEDFSKFKDEVLHDYFVELDKNACTGNASSCFGRLGNWLLPQSGEYMLHINRNEFVGDPLKIASVSKVTDGFGTSQEVLISSNNESPLGPPETSEPSPAFRTVSEGQVMELRVQELRVQDMNLVEPKFERIANPTCVEPYAICQEGQWQCTNRNTESFNCRNTCSGGYRNVCARTLRICVQQTCAGPIGPFSSPAHGGNIRTLGCSCSAWHEECAAWQSQCQGWGQVCDQRRVCERLVSPVPPELPYRTDRVSPAAPDFVWNCTKSVNNQCAPDKWEDHWQSVTTWSLPTLSPSFRPEPLDREKLETLFEGLGIRFSWAKKASGSGDGTATLSCAFADLGYRFLAPDRFVITFKNTDKCAPFNNENRQAGFEPSVGFVNRMSFQKDFQCGTLSENWLGQRIYRCRLPDGNETILETTVTEDESRLGRGERLGIWKTLYPRVELQASIRIIGSALQSIGGGE